jgi:hypothetical protein
LNFLDLYVSIALGTFRLAHTCGESDVYCISPLRQFLLAATCRSAAVDGEAEKPQSGVVEIYFDQADDSGNAGGAEYKAFMRWRPGAVQPDSGPSKLPEEHLYTIADSVARCGRSDETLLWVFDPKKKGGRKLAFRGAFLFEQFSPTVPSALETAWPLPRQCQYNSSEPTFFSTLIIGQTENDNFRFDLQLPVPFPQTSRSAPAELNPATLPFSALYVPRQKDQPPLTRVAVLVIGASARKKTRTFVQEKFFNVGAEKHRLGFFGFSSDGDENSDGFAVCRGNVVAGNTAVLVEHFWPDVAAARIGIIGRLAFIPVVDVAGGIVTIVGPFSPFAIRIEMVVTDV